MENNSLQVQVLQPLQLATQRITELSKSESGAVVLADLLSEELSPEGFEAGELILKTAYGREYTKEKFQLLFAMFTKDRWSEKRFVDTLEWVVKNNQWPEWNPYVFYNAPLQKLHPYSWACEQWAKKIKLKAYKVGEYIFYAFESDEVPLPEYIAEPARFVAPEPETVTDERREEILRELKQRAAVTKEKYSMTTPLGKIAEELGE